MKLIPFDVGRDADKLSCWITDERTHAMWSAMRIPYPITAEGLNDFFSGEAERCDKRFIAVDDSGRAAGFFCLSVRKDVREAMLKFIVVDPERRGKGTAREMLSLAVAHAFEKEGADAVRLCVFDVNVRALKCYEKVGFTLSGTDRDAFVYRDERWSRCHMVIRRDNGSVGVGDGYVL